MRFRWSGWVAIAILSALLVTSCKSSKTDTTGIALQIVELTNQERLRQSLPTLDIDPGLEMLALEHSRNMAVQDFYAHKDRQGREVAERQKELYPTLIQLGVGENIHTKHTQWGLQYATEFVQDWMDSPGHRKNILNQDYTHIGVGVFQTGSDIFATQVFANEMLRLRSTPGTNDRVGSTVRIEFDYVAHQPRDLFKCGLRIPNPHEKVDLDNGFYYQGFMPLKPCWTSGRRGSVTVDLTHGKGKYSFDAGWGDGYYSDLVVITAR